MFMISSSKRDNHVRVYKKLGGIADVKETFQTVHRTHYVSNDAA